MTLLGIIPLTLSTTGRTMPRITTHLLITISRPFHPCYPQRRPPVLVTPLRQYPMVLSPMVPSPLADISFLPQATVPIRLPSGLQEIRRITTNPINRNTRPVGTTHHTGNIMEDGIRNGDDLTPSTTTMGSMILIAEGVTTVAEAAATAMV
jgi:hypothetical protein